MAGIDSGVKMLLVQLLGVDWDQLHGSPRPLVLVLVKRRSTAHCLANYLSCCEALVSVNVRTACLVGHGGRSQDGGTRNQTNVLSGLY